MSSKKHKKHASGSAKQPNTSAKLPAGNKRPAATASGRKNRMPLIIGTVVVVLAIVGVVALSSGGSGGVKATAEELKYLGRLLPEGYEAPTVAEPTVYTSDVPMQDVAAADAGTQMTLPVSEVASKKNVIFDYRRADGQTLPVIAYVKPSGTLFAGISFCPPCEGERQTITADGALTCDSCGTKRNLETEAGISGACKLYPLDEVPVTVAGENIVIEKAVLDGWTAQPLDREIG